MAEEKIGLLLVLKDKMSKVVGTIKKSFSKNMDAMKTSALVFAGAFAGIIAGVYKAVNAFREQERVEAEMEQRLISTGHAAGLTGEEIKKMAGELQKTTGVSDEVTMSAQNMLLTFTNIGKESFPGATEAVLDMTAAMNKGKITQEGLKASAIMLGKGLNDPIGQLGALSRVGIAFTDQQKLQIKAMARAGDMAGAQAIILNELKKEFGGTASNLQTLEGAQRASAAAFGDMLEVIGEAFVPIIKDLAIFVKDASNAFKEFLPKIKDLIVPITVFVGGLTGLLAVGGAVVVLGPMIGAAFVAMTGPIGLAVIAITGITSALLYFKNSNSEMAIKVRAIWQTLSEIISKYAEAISLSVKFKFGKARQAYKEMIDLVKSSREVFKKNVEEEKTSIAESIKAKEEETERKAEIEAAAIEAKLERKTGEQEGTLELDQEFIDRKAEMDAIAEEARREFEAQKTEFEQLTANERLAILTNTLGKERILKDTTRINELIAKGKHEKAMEVQTKLFQDAFAKMNGETLKKLDAGWRNHWAYLLAGQKLNATQRKAVDGAMAQAYRDILQIMGKESVAAFRLMQVASIGQTIMKTYESAQSAFAALAGIPIVGPALGAGAAGIAITAGLMRADAIRRERPPQAETGAYVGKGGYAELHDQEMVLNREQTKNLAASGTQHIYLQLEGETIQAWIRKTDEESRRMERVGIR